MQSMSNENSSQNQSQQIHAVVQQEDKNKNISENLEKMMDFLKNNCPLFSKNFELLNYVNCNATGAVYLGKIKIADKGQKKKRKLLAFKFYNTKKNDQENSKKIINEIKNQKRLHYKYISKIIDVYKMNDSNFFSVSEFGDYGKLDNFLYRFLKKKFLSETFVNYLAKQILEALNFMHKQKIYHLDIKKENIVLDDYLNVKLIDFSSAFNFEGHEPNDLIKFPKIGTGRYMPREILINKEIEIKYGEKIDVYSLGVTLYHLTFGSFPYGLDNIQGSDFDKIAEQLDKDTLKFPTDTKISKMFEKFLMNTLEKYYLKRYSIKDALNDPWIKGWDFINEEKENIGIIGNFIIKLITDNIPQFNDYINYS